MKEFAKTNRIALNAFAQKLLPVSPIDLSILLEKYKNSFGPSFKGLRCETKLSAKKSKCADVKCENDGICLENLGACLCASGFTGKRYL